MRRIAQIIPLLAALCVLWPVTNQAQSPTPDSAVYGPYPENYREIVTAWLDASLVDPATVKVKWRGAPKPGRLAVGKGKEVAGYLVEFSVNVRNIFGTYTGPQKHTALIRDGQVVTATGFVYR